MLSQHSSLVNALLTLLSPLFHSFLDLAAARKEARLGGEAIHPKIGPLMGALGVCRWLGAGPPAVREIASASI